MKMVTLSSPPQSSPEALARVVSRQKDFGMRKTQLWRHIIWLATFFCIAIFANLTLASFLNFSSDSSNTLRKPILKYLKVLWKWDRTIFSQMSTMKETSFNLSSIIMGLFLVPVSRRLKQRRAREKGCFGSIHHWSKWYAEKHSPRAVNMHRKDLDTRTSGHGE